MPFFRNIVRMLIKSIYLGYFTTKSGRSSQRPLHFSTGKQFKFNLYNIYILCLFVCLFWCLFVILFVSNKRQYSWTARTHSFVGPHMAPSGKDGCSKLQKFVSKIFDFRKIWKSTKKKLKIRRICFLTVPWRKC